MLANLSAQLFEHKRITTTETKAKRLRPFAERLITFAKRGDLASRRRVQSVIASRSRTNKGIVHELFENIAPAMAEREGIHTVGELVARSEADLMDIRNFGAKSIDEVKAKLVNWACPSRTRLPVLTSQHAPQQSKRTTPPSATTNSKPDLGRRAAPWGAAHGFHMRRNNYAYPH
jgi:ribosomal protein L17